MSTTYVVADIHGRLDLLEACLSRIEADSTTGRVIFTGDYIDRGPESAKVIQRMIDGPPESWKWVHIRGNHEDMMIDGIKDDDLQLWVLNGGKATLDSYKWDSEAIAPHVQWMENLPRLHTDKLRVYTHAGVDNRYDISEQPEQITQWYRYEQGADVGYRGLHVVHGHTPKADGPELYRDRTNLDTGGFFTGRMCVGVFSDDVHGGPVRLIEVQPEVGEGTA